MTFDDDTIRVPNDVARLLSFQPVQSLAGTLNNFRCKDLGVDWPPPAKLTLKGVELKLLRHSGITDKERAKMKYVCRCAEYGLARFLPTA